MIDAQEFREAGFNEAQTATLVRAFERLDRTSAQRFTLLQDALNGAMIRVDQRFEALISASTASSWPSPNWLRSPRDS